MEVRELEVPAPWGKIAVKLWGDEKNRAILMFHGVLDNAATFDRLIPLLPQHFCYISVDLIGHGKSSHWPKNIPLNTLDNLLAYQIVIGHFKRKKYIIIAHSLGGQLAYLFTQLYPKQIEMLIMLDTVYLHPFSSKSLKNKLVYMHKSYFNTISKLGTGTSPEYTYEEALRRIMEGRVFGAVTKDAAIPLLKRSITKKENGKVVFTHDQRIKTMLNPLFDYRMMYDFIREAPVSCPVFIIFSTESDMQLVLFRDVFKLFKSRKNIVLKIIKGNHNVHNNNPERVALLLNTFLMPSCKL